MELDPIDRIPVVGYQGYRPVYRNPVRKTKADLPQELLSTQQTSFKPSQSQVQSFDPLVIDNIERNVKSYSSPNEY